MNLPPLNTGTVYQPLNQIDILKIESRLPDAVSLLMQTQKLILAGGYIRSLICREEVRDIDLFAPQTVDLNALKSEMETVLVDNDPLLTSAAITFLSNNNTIQLITLYPADSPEKLIESFDFTVCQAAVYFKDGALTGICHPHYYQDLAAKRLQYTSPKRLFPKDVGGSFSRALKYMNRGYQISTSDWATILSEICKSMDPNDLNSEYNRYKEIKKMLKEVY